MGFALGFDCLDCSFILVWVGLLDYVLFVFVVLLALSLGCLVSASFDSFVWWFLCSVCWMCFTSYLLLENYV